MNQDVRDTVAGLALRTVADATALRRVSRAWRLAVDSYVRMLIARSQPGLMPWNRPQATAALEDGGGTPTLLPALAMDLRTRFDDASADDLRLAFTCDSQARVVRLVLVAFALDGAKDTVKEAGWCGPREVRIDSDFSEVGPRLLGYSFHSQQSCTLTKCSRVLLAAASCVVDPEDVLVSASTERMLREVLAMGALATIRRVSVIVDGDSDVLLLATAILERIAPSVTGLRVTLATGLGRPERVASWLSTVQRCTRLTTFAIELWPPTDPQLAAALIDAVADSGAPVTEVSVDAGVIDPSAIVAPLTRLTELQRVHVNDFRDTPDGGTDFEEALLAPLKAQLTHIDANDDMLTEQLLEYPSLQYRRLDWTEDLPDGSWPQLERCLAATRTLNLSLGGSARSFPGDATLASLCPRMEHLMLSNFETGNRLLLPPFLPDSLTELTVLGFPGYAPWVEGVARLPPSQRPTLRCLTLDLGTGIAPALLGWATQLESVSIFSGTRVARHDKSVCALVAGCASTLKRLYLLEGAASTAVDVVCSAPFFPRLAELSCGVETPSEAETMCRIVRERCPRLHRVKMSGADPAAVVRGLGATEWCAASRRPATDVVRRSFMQATGVIVARAPDSL